MKIAALFVHPDGCYAALPGVELWPESRDARTYDGALPVIAHPPCQRWTNLAYVNFKRWGGEHNRPGNDGGCFAAALAAVRRVGGVLEHPAFSHAWPAFGLLRPMTVGWCGGPREWSCEVWQSAYGHRARKRTWLLYVGPKPRQLRWNREPGTHQVGWWDKRGKGANKPTVGNREANATPPEFRDALLALARGVKRP